MRLVIKAKNRDLPSLSEQVARWRRANDMTQTELEQKAGLSHNAVSRIETGQVSPRLNTIERIAHALGLGVEQLQFGAPSSDPDGVREPELEYLTSRIASLDLRRRSSVIRAFQTLLDQIETE